MDREEIVKRLFQIDLKIDSFTEGIHKLGMSMDNTPLNSIDIIALCAEILGCDPRKEHEMNMIYECPVPIDTDGTVDLEDFFKTCRWIVQNNKTRQELKEKKCPVRKR
jgi:hypothetical protein